jgi:tetratricopeptide (TPR) repeat protein
MGASRTRRVLLVAGVNLAVTFALLTATELICRHLEGAKMDLWHPELRKLPPKRASELRVFTIGGSTVWGEPVPKVAFVAQMQYWLHRLYPDRNITIFDFGRRAMDTSYVLEELTRRLDDQPDLIIVITGGNEFLYRAADNKGRIDRVRENLLSNFATMRFLQRAVQRIWKPQSRDLLPCQLEPWDQDSAQYKSKIANFEKNIKLIVERARRRGVTLIVATLPSNLADWPPVYKRLAGRDRRYAEMVQQIRDLIRDEKYQQASEAVTRGFSIYPEDAMLYFLRGQIQSRMGKYAEAHASLVKAKDLDPFPWRATSQIESIIRTATSGVTGVYLVDLEKVYEEHSKNGLVGFDLIYDNCHGTPLGESITAQKMIQKMIDIGLLRASTQVSKECCPVDTFLTDVGYLKPGSPLRLHALLDRAGFAMKTPFFDFEASQRYLQEAMKVDENSWGVWANLATLSYLTGDPASGARELQRAKQLHPGPLDVNDRETTPYLKEALDIAVGRPNDCGAPL